MDSQNYPIEHFRAMCELATALKALPAQLHEHRYSYDAFGSWWVILRHKGIQHRLVFDGRDGRLELQCSSGDDLVLWDKAVWEFSLAPGHELPVAEIAAAIRQLSSVPQSEFGR